MSEECLEPVRTNLTSCAKWVCANAVRISDEFYPDVERWTIELDHNGIRFVPEYGLVASKNS